MNLDFAMRRPEDKAMLLLRRLYELYGYRKYKVSNFEEYSLYLQYKSFLSGEKILSFTDLDGRLLAMRPDVTLSIIKNAHENETAKAYYIEKVYRESKESNTFKEINQMGLELMGKIDDYALAETVFLAQQSLQACADGTDYILELGHMGFVLGLLERLDLLPTEREEIIACLTAKSPHRLRAVMQDIGLSGADQQRLLCLAELSGPVLDVLQRAEQICSGKRMQQALQELNNVYQALNEEEQKHLRLDFSLLNATEFYDGILMNGYLAGLPRPVLSGGRYKMVTNEVKAYFQGQYGQPPAPMDEEVKKQIIRDMPSITHRPADDLPPYLDEARKEIGSLAKNDEDLLLYVMFPQVAKPFLEQKYAG